MTKSITTIFLIVLVSCKINKEIRQQTTSSSGWYSISNENYNSFYNEDSSELFFLSIKPIVSVSDVEKCSIKKGLFDNHYLEMKFNKSAKKKWKQFTTENIGNSVYFVLDSVVIFKALIMTPMAGKTTLTSSNDSTYFSNIKSRIEEINKNQP